mgnify:CR=1 FL=1
MIERIFNDEVGKQRKNTSITSNTEVVETPSIIEDISFIDITKDEHDALSENSNYTDNQADYIERKRRTHELIDSFRDAQLQLQEVQTSLGAKISKANRIVDVKDAFTLKAIKKVFKKKLSYIDNDMYLEAKRQLVALQKESLKEYEQK